MPYPDKLVSVLTGLSRSQLRRLRRKGIVVPEVKPDRPPLYSFRDVVVLRTISFLRNKTSLQKLSKAWDTLDVFELTKHPSEYRFGTDGTTIFIESGTGKAMDLVRNPGQLTMFSFNEVTSAFRGAQGRDVPDLHHPAPGVEIQPGRVGGAPTVEGTRVQSELIASVVDYETVFPEDIQDHYPHITEEQAQNAVVFQNRVREVA